ncbi:MAG: 23S rRNA (pseudouridine(1915)-N(3))-methyltransferase RlmH [Chlamydiia bacterium]
MLIRILCVGRCKEPWLATALAHYVTRSRPYVRVEWEEVADEEPLAKVAERPSTFGLDPQGTLMNSEGWSHWLTRSLELQGSSLTLCIGGAEGFSASLRRQLGQRLISLSPLTMTHQIVRVVLAEQIYRAMLIAHGHPYHK